MLFGPRLRRMQLTTKSARKGYYKGTGVGILGAWDKKNPRKFIVDWDKVKTYVVPKYTEPVAEVRLRTS